MADERKIAEEKLYIGALQSVSGIGAVTIRLLIEVFEEPSIAWHASEAELYALPFMKEAQVRAIVEKRKTFSVDYFYSYLEKERIGYITFIEEEYPPLLAQIYQAPVGLFYKGEWFLPKWPLAMVGARHATPYGKNVAAYFAGALAESGVTIISGGATGIDSVVHEAALQAGGKTIAVLGNGVDIVYPKHNKRLFSLIEEQGLLISEYTPGTKPIGGNFPSRNRIISGLSRGVVVVEAASRSGTLITADYALSEGRDVFAIPGNVLSKHAEGTHWLMRQGAIVLIKPEDVLGEYGWFEEKEGSQIEKTVLSFTLEENIVLQALSSERETPLELILQKTDLSFSKLSVLLLSLELKGAIKSKGNQEYLLTPRR